MVAAFGPNRNTVQAAHSTLPYRRSKSPVCIKIVFLEYMNTQIFLQLGMSLAYGFIIGFEREYQSKAAGLRTITLITVGSTLFTILSANVNGPSDDRIAAQIVTGIGFIGAGVIFKDKFAISGLTTAASIWIASAVGMAIGFNHFLIATVTLVFAMVTLAAFEKVQEWIDAFHQVKIYRIVFHLEFYASERVTMETKMKELRVTGKVKKIVREADDVTFYYMVSGSEEQLDLLADYLICSGKVKSFDE
jgi:putative Mg2+ transporter-C (MgtC) family protein